jgi:hypothetical protein
MPLGELFFALTSSKLDMKGAWYMSEDFSYLIQKIERAEFLKHPFKHIEINDFINSDDFYEIISCGEINIQKFTNDKDLIDNLFSQGYRMVPFPGAITDHEEYIENRKASRGSASHSATESSGLVFRLINPKSEKLKELKRFLESNEFNEALARKFDLDFSLCSTDGGIQKYLDEYEISPHPDLRKKAATFMVNINNSLESENKNHHTHYLKFKPERNYVLEYWKGNPLVERCWVPWDWCETVKQQTRNNSFVAFAPSFDTLHAVRAAYDHLTGQRTQLYGNLWHDVNDGSTFTPSVSRLDWEEFDFRQSAVSVKNRGNILRRLVRKVVRASRKNSGLVDTDRRNNYR